MDGTPKSDLNPNDARALVDRAVDGDVDAKRQLLAHILPTMRGALRALLGRGAEAEDAVQDAAIDVLRGLGTFRGDSNLRAWARTVAVRAGLRRTRKQRPALSLVDPDGLHASAESVPGEGGFSERISRPLAAYLSAIPADQREALVLRHALGYTVPEIAELSSTSVNTIKSRLLKARREVRRMIRQDQTIAGARARGGSDA